MVCESYPRLRLSLIWFCSRSRLHVAAASHLLSARDPAILHDESYRAVPYWSSSHRVVHIVWLGRDHRQPCKLGRRTIAILPSSCGGLARLL